MLDDALEAMLEAKLGGGAEFDDDFDDGECSLCTVLAQAQHYRIQLEHVLRCEPLSCVVKDARSERSDTRMYGTQKVGFHCSEPMVTRAACLRGK